MEKLNIIQVPLTSFVKEGDVIKVSSPGIPDFAEAYKKFPDVGPIGPSKLLSSMYELLVVNHLNPTPSIIQPHSLSKSNVQLGYE